jgi:ABC-type glycerol-3-phosphate transport system substrate-binding protein
MHLPLPTARLGIRRPTASERAPRMRALGALALASATLVLVGCSSSTSSEATADCPDGVTELAVLRAEGNVPADSQLDAYKESHKCVNFSVTEVPFGQYSTKLNVALTSSNAPDIIGVDSPANASMASQGALLPLDEYLPSGYTEDVNSADLQGATYESKVYSLPVQQVAVALFYNKDLTDAAGVTVPTSLDEAWTWDEAKDAMLACQEQAGEGVEGLAASLFEVTVSNTTFRDQLFLRSAGDPEASESSSAYKTYAAISPDGTTVDGYINSPEAIDAATFYQGLFQGDDAVTSTTQIPNEFVDGNACFDLTVAPVVGALDQLSFTGGVSPIPYFTTPIVHSGAVNVAVAAKSKNKEAAAEAVVGLTTGDVETDWANSTNSIPATESSIADSTVLGDPGNKMMLDELAAFGAPRPVTPMYSQYDLYLAKALQSIAQGSDPQQALDQAVSQIDPLLTK